jgi:hypothetical protein
VDKLARISAQDRRDLFSEAAAKLGMKPTIIEKDFWVCLVLKALFTDATFKDALVFKGGTSLSKVFGIIQRFSEDIDLVLDWKLIGYGQGLKDPMQTFPSTTQQDKFNKEINRIAAKFISEKLCPQVDHLVRQAEIGLTATVDETDPHVINIHYPAAFSEKYIRPEVRLEIGPLASWVPSAPHVIRPYAFDVFPKIFENPDCPVIAIAAERTFWEKATILHQEAHRPGPIPQRYSRHYYDLHQLALSPIRDQSFARISLLSDVVEFKKRFYPSSWAQYDLATPGSFKLLPRKQPQIDSLERDYRDMQVMLFGNPPSFDSIIQGLRDLEEQINAIGTTR